MRGRLAQLGVRTSRCARSTRPLQPAAPLLAQDRGWPLPELTSKVPLVTAACRELGVPANRTTLRDLASEIEWAGSSLLVPGSYVQAARSAGRSPIGGGADTLDLPDIARAFAAYQAVKERRNVIDFEDVLLLHDRPLGDRADVADEVRAAYRWFTVDEYQDITPAQEALLSAWVGERDDVCVVGDPSQTIYSFAGADASLPPGLPEALSRHHLDRAGPQLPVEPRRWSRRRTRCSRAVPSAGRRAARSQQPAGQPAPVRRPHPTRSPRRRASRDQITGPAAARHRAGTDGRAVPDQRPVRALRGRARATRGIPYVVRGAARFFERPEVREAVVRLRGSRSVGSTTADLPWLEAVRGVLGGMGWTAERAGRHGARCATAGSRWQSLVAQADGVPGRAPAQRTCRRFVEDLDRRRRRAARPDGRTASPSRPSTRPRGWSGTPSSCAGVQRGHACRSPTPSPRLDRGGGAAAALRRHDPCAPRPQRDLVRCSQPGPGRAPAAVPLPRTAAARTRATPGRWEASRKVARCRECSQPLGTAAGEEAGARAHHPVRYDEGLFERLKAWRLERRPRRRGAGVRRLHRRHPRADRRAQTPFGAGPAADQRHRPDQARPLRRRRSQPRGSTISRKSKNTSKKNCSPQRVHGTLLYPNATAMRTATLTRSCAEAPKEVAQMINTHIATTDSFPSSIGMPVYGRALGAVVGVES